MTTIYLVTDGEYSDYHVVCACSTKELAEGVAKRLGATVEEYELDALTAGARLSYYVHSKEKSTEVDTLSCSEDDELQENYSRVALWNCHLTVQVLATSTEEAVKIAADKFREFVDRHGWKLWLCTLVLRQNQFRTWSGHVKEAPSIDSSGQDLHECRDRILWRLKLEGFEPKKVVEEVTEYHD